MSDTKTVEHDIFDQKDIDSNKYIAALSYFGIFCLVPLLLKRESPFAQFHAKQGLVLAIAFAVGSFVFWIPLIGWAAFLILVVTDLIGLVAVLSGRAWRIPVVQDIVEKMAL